MHDTRIHIPPPLETFLRETITTTGGNEVFFLGRVSWSAREGHRLATLEEVDVLARGNEWSVPAVMEHAERWDLAIHNHPGGDLQPSDADVSLAAELASRSVGFAIISNDASRHYLVTAPFQRQDAEPLDLEEVRAILAPGGPLSRHCKDFEAREGQVEMAVEVARALNDNQILAAEAGTGVGKSFAYLVPAILWAVKNDQRIVIATGTINLQEQLVGKDLPLLKKVMPVEFRFALAKGRSNYACLRKVEELSAHGRQSDLFSKADDKMLRDLIQWAQSSRDGSKADLSWIPPAAIWEEIMSETDKSLKVNCSHYQQCFYYRSKRRASSAQIIVANHHLFFADLALRRQTNNYQYDAVLPSYRRVIFDEAHNLEDTASEYFGVRFSRIGVLLRLGKLYSTAGRSRGKIPAIIERLRNLGDGTAAGSIENAFSESMPEVAGRVNDHFDEIEQALVDRDLSRLEATAAEDAGSTTIQVRYRGDGTADPFWQTVSQALEGLQKELALVVKVNDRAVDILKTARVDEKWRPGMLLELTSASSRFGHLLEQVEVFRNFEDAKQVRWITRKNLPRRRGGTSIEFGSAPIRVATHLKEGVFDPMGTVVLTSATLSVAGKIDFFADRIGLSLLEESRFRFRQHASPFDFKRQVMTVIPADFPLPQSPDYARQVPEAVWQILRVTRGRAFVLFTSYSLLRRTYEALEGRLSAAGLRPSAQGSLARSELLERFRAGVINVLFATDSFWEGVDVKGRALECVIITRLPFRVPSEPIQEARLEDLQKEGLNPFTAFTIPQAVLKFKQGFGRLIRASSDRGVVALLDRRIVTKPYGKVFLKSLPQTDLRIAPLQSLTVDIEAFFSRENIPPKAALKIVPQAPD